MRTLANSPALQPGELAAALLNPRAVALVGASADASKVTARAQRYLRKHGFRGAILPVNPRHAEVFGEPAFASPADLPEPVDHAFIMVASAAVPDALKACGERGVRCVTVLADGFADQGPEGAALQERLVETARAHGVRRPSGLTEQGPSVGDTPASARPEKPTPEPRDERIRPERATTELGRWQLPERHTPKRSTSSTRRACRSATQLRAGPG